VDDLGLGDFDEEAPTEPQTRWPWDEERITAPRITS
jgi:hypothetical protein